MENVAELRRLAQDCKYGDTLQQMLRDRIVCGINEDLIQRRLLAETDLTFDRALSTAVAAETANRNAQDLQNPGATVKHFNVNNGPQDAGTFRVATRECYRCKGSKHVATDCTLKGTKATIHVKANAVPRFFRPRSVPYAMRAKVDEEIDRLLEEGIITPMKYAEWAAPVVPILKPVGTSRGPVCRTVRRKTVPQVGYESRVPADTPG
ncbi:uncharacterized protein LOC116676762 [Etheostoma spectabile]|uniref:uncharacterized protein LOC116676762 n=1 Tax=Etheostoma spectabile TaxID=54343 RepID=UPI0013AEC9F7|nr:uncharacterized protein LOC116676762 [Etheostoma spectabile]